MFGHKASRQRGVPSDRNREKSLVAVQVFATSKKKNTKTEKC